MHPLTHINRKSCKDTVMNEEQLNRVISSHGADILRFCRITAGSREDGDELYQDTMLTLLEKQEQLDHQQNVKSYAISVALRLWQNRKRKIARRLRLVPQESLEALADLGYSGPDNTPDPEKILLHRQQLQQIRQTVACLPEKYRLPIQLYYSAGLTVAAIAQILRLPQNTVKSRLHRGKQIIRKELEETEHD